MAKKGYAQDRAYSRRKRTDISQEAGWQERQPLTGKSRFLRFVFSLAFNIFMMLLLYRLFDPVFEGSDDITVVQFVNGSCGSFDPHMVYQNYLVGLVLTGLYRHFPLIPWYSWFQFLGLCASFTAITYVLCCRVRKGAGFALALLVQSFAAYECYINIQYTKTAGVLAAAGMLLIWNGLWGGGEDRKILKADLLWGISLVICSVLGRYAQSAACAALTAGIPLLMFLDAGKNKSVPGRGRIFCRCLITCLVLGALCAALVVFDRNIYEKDPVWKNFVEYNNTRSELMDYGMPKFEEYEDIYKELGISRTAYDLFDTWNSGDTDVFSTEVMKKLLQVRKAKEPGLETVKEFAREVPKGFLKNRLVKCFLVALGLWLLFGRHDGRALAALAAEILLFGALYYYLFLKGRYLYNRVDVGLWISALTVLLWTWKPAHRSGAANAGRTILILAVMAVCAFIQIPGWKGRLSSHCADSRKNRQETREKMMEISKDTDHLYVSKLGILSASRFSGPFEPMPQGILGNVILLGGWKVESAPYNAVLQKYGFSHNPYEAIAGLSEKSPDVFLLDEDPDTTIAYLREYYNPDAQMMEAGEWNGKTVRQVLSVD